MYCKEGKCQTDNGSTKRIVAVVAAVIVVVVLIVVFAIGNSVTSEQSRTIENSDIEVVENVTVEDENETGKTDEMDETDEADENDEADVTDEVDETEETVETYESDATEESDETDESDGEETEENSEETLVEETDSAGDDTNTSTTIDVFTIDYSEYVDVSNWKDTLVTEDMLVEPEYLTQYALANELSDTYYIKITDDITDRGVQGGDIVSVDYVAYVDGIELESVTDQSIMIGLGGYADEIEEGLLGAEVGDELTLEVTYPDSHINPELRGREVIYEVKVRAIAGLGEVSDDDINSATDGEYTTYDDFVAAFMEEHAEEYKETIIWQELLETVDELAVCETVRDYYINMYISTYTEIAEAYEMDLETFLYFVFNCPSVEEYKASLEPEAEDYALKICTVLAIADMENITVDDEEVDELYNMILKYSSEKRSWSDVKFKMLFELVDEYVCDTIQVQ